MTAVLALDGLGWWLLVGLAATPVVLGALGLIACLGAGANHASPLPTRDRRLRIPTSPRRLDAIDEADHHLREPYQ